MVERHLTSEQLSSHLDGELTATEKERAENHLSQCRECCDRLAEIRSLETLLKKTAVDPGAPDLEGASGRIVGRILFRRRAIRTSFAVAATLLITLSVYLVSKISQDSPRPEQRPLQEKLAVILRTFSESDSIERESLAKKVFSMGDDAIPPLVSFLDDPDVTMQLAASRMLGLCSNRKAAELIAAAAGKRGVLDEEEEILGEIGSDADDVSAIPSLVKLLKSGTAREQIRAAELLCRFDDEAAIGTAISHAEAEGLCDENNDGILGEFGSDEEDRKLIPHLIEMVDKPSTRDFALHSLRQMGLFHQRDVVNAVLNLLLSQDPALEQKAVDIIVHTDIYFLPEDLVRMLDIPALRESARKALVEVSAKHFNNRTDLGFDKKAWKSWLKSAAKK